MFDDAGAAGGLSRAYPTLVWAVSDQTAFLLSPPMLAGALTVITCLDLYCYGGGGATDYVQFTTTETDATFAQFAVNPAQPSSYQWRGWQVVSPGIQIGFGHLGGETYDFRLSGWVYPAPGWTPF